MGFAARLALFCALAMTTPSIAAHSRLGGFLGRMRAANGPVWRVHLAATALFTNRATAIGVRIDTLGLRLVSQRCRGQICNGNYFDGRRVYAVGPNGTPLLRSTQTDFGLRGTRTITSLDFLARDFTADGGHIEDAGFTRFGGRRLRLLLVANSDATPMQIFVDPATARVRYVVNIFERTTSEYLDYRDVGDGIRLPMEVIRNGRIVQRYTRRWVSRNVFPTPHPLPIIFSAPSVAIATDPKSSIPIFACTIGGIDARCLLDSGNTGLAMSLTMAERLKAPTIGALQVSGIGRYMTSMVRAGPLHFGNATLPLADYAVLDDIARDNYDVILGADAFAAMRIEINFRTHRVRLNPAPRHDGITLPLRFVNFIPVVRVALGSLEAQLAVDTGDESSINLSERFYRAHPTLFSPTQRRPVSGIGGRSVESVGRIAHVTVGSDVLDNQSIGVTQALAGLVDGHLGASFFKQFTLILNYASNQLRLIPHENVR